MKYFRVLVFFVLLLPNVISSNFWNTVKGGFEEFGKRLERGSINMGKDIDKHIISPIDKAFTNLMSQEKDNKAYKPYIPKDRAEKDPNKLNILSWNVFLRPHTLFKNGQFIRSGKNFIPAAIGDYYDVIVFAEVFDDAARKQLVNNMKAIGYKYATPVLGEKKADLTNGGILIMSKFPIEKIKQRLFNKICKGSDCLAAKGVLYAQINKHGKKVHVFGSHTQAWQGKENVEIRNKQFASIKQLIDKLRISPNEPVIIAGDFNVDKFNEPENYKKMLKLLHAQDTPAKGNKYTIDPNLNAFAKKKEHELLDYVLYSVDHKIPKQSYNKVIPVESPKLWKSYPHEKYKDDLSDHFPIHGYFSF